MSEYPESFLMNSRQFAKFSGIGIDEHQMLWARAEGRKRVKPSAGSRSEDVPEGGIVQYEQSN